MLDSRCVLVGTHRHPKYPKCRDPIQLAKTHFKPRLCAVSATTGERGYDVSEGGPANTMWCKLLYSEFEAYFGPSTQGAGIRYFEKKGERSRHLSLTGHG